MNTPYTPSSEETAVEKARLIVMVQPELKEHGLVDLTAFIEKHSKDGFKHSGFVRSVAYKAEELGFAEVIPQKEWTVFFIKRTIFSKRHPYKYAFILGAIGLLFSVVAGVTIAVTQQLIKELWVPSNIQSTRKTDHRVYDSVTNSPSYPPNPQKNP
ncbi:MAG: hypothetical protein J0H74_06885 [Chitinophagaceae bacterium]|nr:hypothetical protein [Chitinophagaceae bacterium]